MNDEQEVLEMVDRIRQRLSRLISGGVNSADDLGDLEDEVSGLFKKLTGLFDERARELETQQERLLRAELLEQLVAQIDEMLSLRDLEGGVLYVNNAFTKLFRLPIEEAYSRPRLFLEYIHPDDLERVKATYQAHLLTGRMDLVSRIVREDGVRWLRTRNFPVHDKSANVHRVASVTQDITEAKELELELRDHEERLQDEVDQRTKELVRRERQLAEQNLQLEEKNIALGELVRQLNREREQIREDMVGQRTQPADASAQPTPGAPRRA